MSSFTAATLVPTISHDAAGHELYAVQGSTGQGMTFWIGAPDSGLAIHVPEDFLTDGPSLPGWLVRVLPSPLVRWVRRCLTKASVVHDRLLEDLQFTLIDADAQFLVAMSADLPGWAGPMWARVLLREIAFIAVRFNRDRQP